MILGCPNTARGFQQLSGSPGSGAWGHCFPFPLLGQQPQRCTPSTEGLLRGLLSQTLEAGCFYVDTRKFDKGRLLSLAGTWGKASEVPLPLPQQSPVA